jgi:hypothetical protein
LLKNVKNLFPTKKTLPQRTRKSTQCRLRTCPRAIAPFPQSRSLFEELFPDPVSSSTVALDCPYLDQKVLLRAAAVTKLEVAIAANATANRKKEVRETQRASWEHPRNFFRQHPHGRYLASRALILK